MTSDKALKKATVHKPQNIPNQGIGKANTSATSAIASFLEADDATHKHWHLLRSMKHQKEWTIHGEQLLLQGAHTNFDTRGSRCSGSLFIHLHHTQTHNRGVSISRTQHSRLVENFWRLTSKSNFKLSKCAKRDSILKCVDLG